MGDAINLHIPQKENLNTSSLELMYGASFTMSGESFLYMKSDLDAKRYLVQLRDSVSQLHPISMIQLDHLYQLTSAWLFVRCDKKPSSHPTMAHTKTDHS